MEETPLVNNLHSKVVLATNIPAPYRTKMHELISERLNGSYTVIYCADKEADRKWKLKQGSYKKVILSKISNNAVHNNLSIVKHLFKINPEVLIIMGFYPSMLYGYLWSLFKFRKLIVFTDGTLTSESHLTVVHRVVRKIVFKKVSAFITPSEGGASLYASYNIPMTNIFRTYLCVNNASVKSKPFSEKTFDLMFSGQFIDRKMPFFFNETAKLLKESLGKCKILLLGNGPLEHEIIDLLNKYELDYTYPGFIDQASLPNYYSDSKLFLFPTKNDPWGVVANEAMASGTPVITCKNAGVANDLVINGENGLVLPLSEKVWVEKIVEIYNNPNEYTRLSKNAITHVQKYNSENASKAMIDAINFVNK